MHMHHSCHANASQLSCMNYVPWFFLRTQGKQNSDSFGTIRSNIKKFNCTKNKKEISLMDNVVILHKDRNSAIELLRIVCMMFIIGLHVIGFGIVPTFHSDLFFGGSNYIICKSLHAVFCVAVDTFVIISGYFGLRFKPRKILKIWLMVLFYSYLIFVLKCIFAGGVDQHDISYLFPIISRKYWFISVYFVLCLISLLINKMITTLSQSQLHHVVLVLFAVYYGWATFSYCLNFPQMIPDFGGGIVNFIVLYLIGRDIRLNFNRKIKTGTYFLAFASIVIISVLLETIICSILHFDFSSFENDDTVFTVLCAITLFLAFRNIHFQSRLINLLAVNCLAVFVIHMNDIAMPLIRDVFHLQEVTGWTIVLTCLCIPVIVYIVGITIEAIRKLLMSKIEDWIINFMEKQLKKAHLCWIS